MIEEVCVIGTGTLAISCAEYAKECDMPVILFDMGKKSSAIMKKQAERKDLPYFHKEAKEVFSYLCKGKKNILLVSAINEVIVPKEVLEEEKIVAINLHQALLPAHPGRNAEAWAIFEQDDIAGITWHMMETKVDKGDILIQKEIVLENQTTSFSLFRQQISCAYHAFQEIFDSLLDGTYQRVPQKQCQLYSYHFKKDVPNNGWLNTDWNAKKMSAFLRAMDYGVLDIWDSPRICVGDVVYEWKKYEITQLGQEENREPLIEIIDEKHIKIRKEEIEIFLKNCKIWR